MCFLQHPSKHQYIEVENRRLISELLIVTQIHAHVTWGYINLLVGVCRTTLSGSSTDSHASIDFSVQSSLGGVKDTERHCNLKRPLRNLMHVMHRPVEMAAESGHYISYKKH